MVDQVELVERVARAIFDQLCSGVHSPMARLQYARQRRYKEAARAAIEAMSPHPNNTGEV